MLNRQKLVGVFITAGLLLSACGGGSESSSNAQNNAPVKIVPVKGCEKATFQANRGTQSAPTRCEPGTPAPAPLQKTADVTVAVPSDKIGTVTPLVMADVLGEFKKENLNVQIEIMPSTDAVQLVAASKIDAMAGSASVAIFNAVQQGFRIRQIIGDGWQSPNSKMGVWTRADLDTADLRHRKIGSAIGVGSSVNGAFRDLLAQEGLKLTDLTWETVDVADSVTALKNGAVDAALLLDPFWLQLTGSSKFKFVAPAIRPGDNIGGVHAGPKLLSRRDVAVAFTRAYIRTVNTYFRDINWQDDAELMKKISDRLKVPVDSLKAVPGELYNLDIPAGAATALQEMYIEANTMAAAKPMPEKDFVDRSFVAQAVGQQRP